MTIKELQDAIKEEIYSRWGTDPMCFAGSDDATEAKWAKADARLIEMLYKIADEAPSEKNERINKLWMEEDVPTGIRPICPVCGSEVSVVHDTYPLTQDYIILAHCNRCGKTGKAVITHDRMATAGNIMSLMIEETHKAVMRIGGDSNGR